MVEPIQVTPEFITTIGTRLYGHRTKGRGSWQKRMAQLLGVTDRQLARYLTGATPISEKRATQLKRLYYDLVVTFDMKMMELSAYHATRKTEGFPVK